MAILTDSSTFEYARDWLASSECFLRDIMLADAVELDVARDQAKARIHRDEVLDEPDIEAEGEAAPGLPVPVDSRPRAVIVKSEDRRELAGTGTWRGIGTLAISIEVPFPTAYRFLEGDSSAARATKFKAFKAWGDRLVNTLRLELMATSGRSDEAGNPYLNATDVDIELQPIDQAAEESVPFVAFELRVEWR